MAVTKASAELLYDEERPYVTVPSDSIARLSNPDAVAIFLYLLDKPADWKIREKDVCARFGIGRRRWRAAIAELREQHLMRSFRVKSRSSQKYVGHEYDLVASPELWP